MFSWYRNQTWNNLEFRVEVHMMIRAVLDGGDSTCEQTCFSRMLHQDVSPWRFTISVDKVGTSHQGLSEFSGNIDFW